MICARSPIGPIPWARKILGLDDRWESFVGSGKPDRKRFPQFDEDIGYVKAKGLNLGFWQPAGWVDHPERVGLSTKDLVVGMDGQPRRVAWDTNPRSRSHYCLDPSSPSAVEFLRRRTISLMKKYRPVLLKLDFGYGLPSPNAGVPRDPSLRGERYSLASSKLLPAPLDRLIETLPLSTTACIRRFEVSQMWSHWTIWATRATKKRWDTGSGVSGPGSALANQTLWLRAATTGTRMRK